MIYWLCNRTPKLDIINISYYNDLKVYKLTIWLSHIAASQVWSISYCFCPRNFSCQHYLCSKLKYKKKITNSMIGDSTSLITLSYHLEQPVYRAYLVMKSLKYSDLQKVIFHKFLSLDFYNYQAIYWFAMTCFPF